MGLLERYALATGAAQGRESARIRGVLEALGWSAARDRAHVERFMLPSQIERLFDEAPAHYEKNISGFSAISKPR